MAPIPITRAEYAAKFGGGASSSGPIPITRAEYAAKFAAPTQEPSFFDSVLTGIENSPAALWGAIKSVPSGASNLWNSFTSPVESANDGTLERTLRGTGAISSGIAGAGAGALGGAPLAPFTLGLSVPVGAALGGAAGMMGFDWLNELTGSDEATTAEEKAQKLAENFGSGIGGAAVTKGVGLAAKGAGKVTQGVSTYLDDAAQSLKERALGIQYGDKKGGLGKTAAYLDDQGNVVPRELATDTSSSIQQKLQMLDDSGVINKLSNKPSEALAQLSRHNAETQLLIGNLVDKADNAAPPTSFLPTWDGLKSFISGLRKSDQDALAPEIIKIQADYAATPGAGLDKIITLKHQLGDAAKFHAKEAPLKAQLYQKAYLDLKAMGENVFDAALPAQKGAFGQANQLASAEAAILKTLPKEAGRNRPGVVETLMTPTGSGAYVGAGSVGALLGSAAIPALAATTWLGRGVYQGAKNNAPLTLSRALKAGSNKVANASQTLANAGNLADAASQIVPPFLMSSGSSPSRDGKASTLSTKGKGILQRKNSEVRSQVASSSADSTAQPITKAITKGMSRAEFDELARTGPMEFQKSAEIGVRQKMKAGKTEAQAKDEVYKEMSVTSAITKLSEHTGKDLNSLSPLVNAVIDQESAGKPNAVSDKGALGFMQVMPKTGKELAKELGESYRPKDADQNIRLGTLYLTKLLPMFDYDLELALTAYHSGENRVKNLLRKTGGKSLTDIKSHLGPVGKRYADSVLRRLKQTA
jgi:hypothetical protein